MSTIEIPNKPNTRFAVGTNLTSRIFAITYALFAYAVGAGALFWFFFAAAGIAPYSLSNIETSSVIKALTINTFLVFLFATQHTIMARTSFKQKLTRIIPAHLERATFVLAAGLFLAIMLWYWQPLPGSIWSLQNEYYRLALLSLSFAGVIYVLVTSLVTNHFELFGIRQAWLYATGKTYTPLEFKRHWVYKYSRHPMMLGLLIVIWSTADMSATRLVLAVLLTTYLFIGIQFEERSLIQEFGDKYQEYKKEIGMFFTFR
ncbi:MAG: NnrU family protein [Nitrosomonas sp.]|nr:NnrU family protein [Nitrosomonas sp.]